MLTTHTHCRLCSSASLVPVLDLGEHALHGTFAPPGEPLPTLRVPLRVLRCPHCGLVQQAVSVDPKLLYGRYSYRSSVNEQVRQHLAALSAEATAMLGHPPTTVLDIGGNDGLFLNHFPYSDRTCIDPSDVAERNPNRHRTIRGTFPDAMMFTHRYELITSIACFYDVDDPVRFASAVARILEPGGLWCLEVAYLLDVLRNNDVGFFCQEHCALWSLTTLCRCLEMAGLKAVRFYLNPFNGGSMRVYVAHASERRYDTIDDCDFMEWVLSAEARFTASSHFADFADHVHRNIAAIRAAILAYREQGKTVHLLGASTKANVLLQAAGLGPDLILYASDRDPHKHGWRTSGGIPIISEEQSRAMRPDVYLVGLSWFRDQLLERERAALEAGTEFLFPLPAVEICKVPAQITERKRANEPCGKVS